MARATNPLYGGLQLASDAWAVRYDCCGTDVSVTPDAHTQAWTKTETGSPTASAVNALLTLTTPIAGAGMIYAYNVADLETYTGGYVEALVKMVTGPSTLDSGCTLAVELGDAGAGCFMRPTGINLMGAEDLAVDLTDWTWVRVGAYGAESRLWLNGTLVQSGGLGYLTSNRRAQWGIAPGNGPASAIWRYVQARSMWGAERLWSDAYMTIGPFTETLVDFPADPDGASYRFIHADHAAEANFSLPAAPVFAMAGYEYISDAGVLVEILGDAGPTGFDAKVTNLSFVGDQGYGAAGPDVVLTWTRCGLVAP